MNRRRFMLTAGALVAAACGKPRSLQPGAAPPSLGGDGYDGQEVTLSFWNGFTGGDGPPMRALVAEFNATHARIKVRMNAIRWDDYYRRIPVAAVSASGPDVGVIQQHQLVSSAARGVVVPLDSLAEVFGLVERDFFAPVWRGGVYRNQRYGIPLDVHPLGMYYNERAFAAAGILHPPETREEFDDALARLKANGFAHPFWIPTTWPAHLMFESLLWQHGGAPFADDGSDVSFATEAGEKSILWMQQMYRRDYSPRAVAIDGQWNAFVNGTNAIVWDGVWMLQNTSDVRGGARVAPLPRIGGRRAAWANAHHLVLFGRPRLDAARVQASMVFVTWLSQHSLEWARAGQVPARTSVRESRAFAALAGQATFARELPDVRLVPVAAGVVDLQDDAVVFAVDAALRSGAPREALGQAERLANDQLRALRAPFAR